MKTIEDLREDLYSTILGLENLDELEFYLPLPIQQNFDEVIIGLKIRLAKELNEYKQFLQQEYSEETITMINRITNLIERVNKYVIEKTNDFNQEEEISQEQRLPKRHLIFGKTESGRIPFYDDIKKDIPKEFYETLYDMIQSLIYEDIFSMNDTKFKKLVGHPELKTLFERKEFKIRISLIPITRDFIYVERALLKKSDNDTVYQNDMKKRKEALYLDYQRRKQQVKEQQNLDLIFKEEDEALDKIYQIMQNKLEKVSEHNGKSK